MKLIKLILLCSLSVVLVRCAAGKKNKVSYTDLQIKYAKILNVEPYKIINQKLYGFINEWYGTPYCMGGTTTKCIDCSAFIQKLLLNVYAVNIPRTSIEQFLKVVKFSETKYLSEGDLVFFHTVEDKDISHVGLYLQNHFFINAAESKGVSIANINDNYWKQSFIGSGRVKIMP